jgi:GT2 family glycosyltransferase
MTDLVVVTCTEKNEGNFKNTRIAKWYSEIQETHPNIKLDVIFNNQNGLPENYNKKIKEYSNTNIEYMVFVHDDVYIDDLKIIQKLKHAHDTLKYDIIGLAGCLNPTIKSPTLWHIMGSRENHRGFVNHYIKDDIQFATHFGYTPSRVAVIDGLFIGIHLPTILKSGWCFNEKYKFHHYDIASCLDANKSKLKIGVYPIHVVHESHGLSSFEDPLWNKSNEIFLKEYGR